MRNHLSTTFSGLLDRLFNQPKLQTIIIGNDARLRLLGIELAAAGKLVKLIDLRDHHEPTAPASNKKIVDAALEDFEVLSESEAEKANCLVAAGNIDGRNLSLCRTARERFQTPITIARLRMLKGVTSWVRLTERGMVRMKWPDAGKTILGDVATTTTSSRLLTARDEDQFVDVAMRSPVFVGRKPGELLL